MITLPSVGQSDRYTRKEQKQPRSLTKVKILFFSLRVFSVTFKKDRHTRFAIPVMCLSFLQRVFLKYYPLKYPDFLPILI